MIVVEIDPGSLRAAILDLGRPVCQFLLCVIVPIPAFRAMEAYIDFVRRANEFIWQSRRAAGAEDNACLAKGVVDFLVPPAGVPEFDDVAPRGIELTYDVLEPYLGVAIARRQLKKEAAHSVSENIGDHSEVLYESFRALEFLHVGNELADFYGVDKPLLTEPALPRLNVRHRGP